MVYIPEDCQYIAKIKNGELVSFMESGHLEFAKAIIKDVENTIKIAIPCKCSICRPNQDIKELEKEHSDLMTKINLLSIETTLEKDVDKLNELNKNIKKILLMQIDNCQLNL